MNKRVVTLSVVGILGLMGMSGCSSETSGLKINDEDVIVTIGEGDSAEHYTANELFDKYLGTTSGTSAAFNAVYDVLVDRAVEVDQELKSTIDFEVDQLQRKATENASTNGTNYNEELSKLLESENVEDIEEYSKKISLREKKREFEEDYYDEQIFEGKKKEDIKEDGNALMREYIKANNPYHVRHILVKTSSAGNGLFPASETLTANEAKNLGNTIKNLASPSMTFGNVAEIYSEDGSAAEFGSLNELMGKTTGYVSEFKFAVFQYDAYLNAAAKEEAKDLNIPEKIQISDEENNNLVTADVLKNAVNYIPYSVADQLLTYAELEKAPNGDLVKEGKSYYYPRNILFNKYFSNHGLNFIVRGEAKLDENAHFAHIEGASKSADAKDDILCDEKGRPILVTRAGSGSGDSGYQGVHFILIENSPFVNEDNPSVAHSINDEILYYSTYVPSVSESLEGRRFVTYYNSSTKDDYNSRAETITKGVKEYDPNIKFRLYEEVLSTLSTLGYKVNINETIKENIEKYIESTRYKSALSKEETYEASWKSYVRLLQAQKDFESYKLNTSEISAFLPEGNVYEEAK